MAKVLSTDFDRRERLIASIEDIPDGIKRDPDASWRVAELRKAVEALEEQMGGYYGDERCGK